MHQDMSEALSQIREQLPESPENNLSISANVRQARKQLREICQNACLKWQEYLTSLAEAAGQTNDKWKQRIILHLKHAKQN